MAKRVTLTGIQRRGLSEWRAREWWCGKSVRIWSREHCAWWRDNAQGYTDDEAEAGIYTFPEAFDATKHCGPEKGICFYAVRGAVL